MAPVARCIANRRLPPRSGAGSCATSSPGRAKSKSETFTRVGIGEWRGGSERPRNVSITQNSHLLTTPHSPLTTSQVAPDDVVSLVAPDDVVDILARDVTPHDVVVPETRHHVGRPHTAHHAISPDDVVVGGVAPHDIARAAPGHGLLHAP